MCRTPDVTFVPLSILAVTVELPNGLLFICSLYRHSVPLHEKRGLNPRTTVWFGQPVETTLTNSSVLIYRLTARSADRER